jgi:hypothetical protein
MKILAGSLEQAASAFLHAGYISAYSRPLNAFQHETLQAYLSGEDLRVYSAETDSYVVKSVEPLLTLNMTAALRLEGEDLTDAPQSPPPAQEATPIGVAPASIGGGAGWDLPLSGIALFVGAMVIIYSLRELRRRGRLPRWIPIVAVIALVVISVPVLLGVARALPPKPLLLPPDTPAPWTDVSVQAYADPDSATLAIMYGIVAEALSCVPAPVAHLAQLQNEVGIPSASLTEGQRYALQAYGLDGWGKPLRLESQGIDELVLANGRLGDSSYSLGREAHFYRLSSAGPDGVFESDDDIVLKIDVATEHMWDSMQRTFYFCRDGEAPVLMYHRWAGRMFHYHDRERARRLTGTDLFDTLAMGQRHALPGAKAHDPIASTYDTIAAGLPYDPIVLLVLPRRHEL